MEYFYFFRLKGPPFQPASPHSAVYLSPTHLEGLATLESGLTGELSGLTLLTGEAGSGKTTLIYSLLQRDHKRVRIAYIDDPKLSFLEIMRSILAQMNLYSAGSTKLDYLNALDHLLKLRGKEERIAVVVDEAQLLSDDVLEELRLLSNRGQQRSDRCLQLILVGQPELAERLKKPQLRQLNQRISSRGVLKPLTTAQAMTYVECRIGAQGGKCSAIFEAGGLDHLIRRSDGLPRKINMLCHDAMLAAFHAGERKVSVRMAKKVASQYHDSVGIRHEGFAWRRLAMPALIASTATASALLVGVAYRQNQSHRIFDHTAPSGEPIEQTTGPFQAVKARKTAQQAVQRDLGSGPKRKALASLESGPLELQIVSEAAEPAPKGEVTMAAVSDTPTRVSRDSEQRTQITVRYGDTLEKIAVRYFGSKSGINELMEANPQLTNINRLNVGDVIYLPRGVAPKASDDQSATTPAPDLKNSPERHGQSPWARPGEQSLHQGFIHTTR